MGEHGAGMPASMHLDLFGEVLHDIFGVRAYMVGSATTSTTWRDVDVRVLLRDDDFAVWFPNQQPGHERFDRKWRGLCMALSALGQQMTGLPIDFQIQQQTTANDRYKGGRRDPLGLRIDPPVPVEVNTDGK